METSPVHNAANAQRNDGVRRQSFTVTEPTQGRAAKAVGLYALTVERTSSDNFPVARASQPARLGSWRPDYSSLPNNLISPVILRFLTHLEAAGFARTSRHIRELVLSDATFGSIRASIGTLQPHLVNAAIMNDAAHNGTARKIVKAADCNMLVYRSLQAKAWSPAVRSLLAHGITAGEATGLDHHTELDQCTAWEIQARNDGASLPQPEVMALFDKVNDNASTADYMRGVLQAARPDSTTGESNTYYLLPILAELQKLVLESALYAITGSLMVQRAQHRLQAQQAQTAQAVQEPLPQSSHALPSSQNGFAKLPGVLMSPILQFMLFLEATSLAGTCKEERKRVLSDPGYSMLSPLTIHVGNVNTLTRSHAMKADRFDAARSDAAAFRHNAALWMPTVEALLAPGIHGRQLVCPEHQAMLLKCDAWIQQAEENAAYIPAHEVMAVMQRIGAGTGPQELVHDALFAAAVAGYAKLKLILLAAREMVLESALDTIAARLAGQPAQQHPPSTAWPRPPLNASRRLGQGHYAVAGQFRAWMRQAYRDPAQVPVDEVMAVVRCIGTAAPDQKAIRDAMQSAVQLGASRGGIPLMKSAITEVQDLVTGSLLDMTLKGLNPSSVWAGPMSDSPPI